MSKYYYITADCFILAIATEKWEQKREWFQMKCGEVAQQDLCCGCGDNYSKACTTYLQKQKKE